MTSPYLLLKGYKMLGLASKLHHHIDELSTEQQGDTDALKHYYIANREKRSFMSGSLPPLSKMEQQAVTSLLNGIRRNGGDAIIRESLMIAAALTAGPLGVGFAHLSRNITTDPTESAQNMARAVGANQSLNIFQRAQQERERIEKDKSLPWWKRALFSELLHHVEDWSFVYTIFAGFPAGAVGAGAGKAAQAIDGLINRPETFSAMAYLIGMVAHERSQGLSDEKITDMLQRRAAYAEAAFHALAYEQGPEVYCRETLDALVNYHAFLTAIPEKKRMTEENNMLSYIEREGIVANQALFDAAQRDCSQANTLRP